MNDQNDPLKDIKTMLLGIALMIFALGVLAFGYLWSPETTGFAVCYYGGLVLFVIGATYTWDGWSRHRSQKPRFIPGESAHTKEES